MAGGGGGAHRKQETKGIAVLILVISSALIAVAVAWAGFSIARQLAAARADRARARILEILALFTPGIAAASSDPRALLTWQPLASTARTLFPAEFSELDRTSGGAFPFSAAFLEAAHAQWSADWLAWERTHDAEYKLKAAAIEAEPGGATALSRARHEAVEREKLELYHRRYADYVRISKALQTLIGGRSA
jgi:hypothetical protein